MRSIHRAIGPGKEVEGGGARRHKIATALTLILWGPGQGCLIVLASFSLDKAQRFVRHLKLPELFS